MFLGRKVFLLCPHGQNCRARVSSDSQKNCKPASFVCSPEEKKENMYTPASQENELPKETRVCLLFLKSKRVSLCGTYGSPVAGVEWKPTSAASQQRHTHRILPRLGAPGVV